MGRTLNPGTGGVASASTASATTTAVTEDPRKEGYPAYFSLYGSGNNYFNSKVLGSDLQPLGSPYSSTGYTTSSYYQGINNDPMYGYNKDAGQPTGSLSSQNYSSYTIWMQSWHHSDQYPRNRLINCGVNAHWKGDSIHNIQYGILGYGNYLGTHVLPEGCRPRRYLTLNNNTIQEVNSLAQMYGYGANKNGFSIDSTKSAPNEYATSAAGSFGYNEKTKTLVLIQGNTSGYDVYKYKSDTHELNSMEGSAWPFFRDATVTKGTITNSPFYVPNNNEDAYNIRVIVGDNDYVAAVLWGGNYVSSVLINPDLTVDYSINPANNGYFGQIQCTTTYGASNNRAYAPKAKFTWDNKWALVGMPYYYYGCGICAYIISTEDPRRFFQWRNTNSGGGAQVFPWKKSSFIYFGGDQNLNSQGMYYAYIDLSETSRTGTDGATITDSDGRRQIANGTVLNPTNRHSAEPSLYHTTNYNHIQPLNWWPRGDVAGGYQNG